MTLPGLVGLFLAWSVGVATVGLLWPRDWSRRDHLLLIGALGLGVGLGVTSVTFFAASLLSPRPVQIAVAFDILLISGVATQLWCRRQALAPRSPAPKESCSWLFAIVAALFIQAAMVTVVISLRAYDAEPFGSWDGWAIWNMHARFLFRGGSEWTQLLDRPQLAWTHLDYPLGVSASVARLWAFAGQDRPEMAGLVSLCFALATLGVLVAGVARLRAGLVAGAAGLLLVGTPFFATFAASQHADIPLGFFILATLVLLALTPPARGVIPLSLLAGLCAGLAAWTKNEGMLFVLVVSAGWMMVTIRREAPKSFGGFLGGLLIALAPVVFFKMALAPSNDIASTELAQRLPNLWDLTRHRVILASFWRDAGRFGEWSITPFLAMALGLVGTGWRRLKASEWMIALVIGAMLMGYYLIYLITPWDLAWHLDSSLVRLLLQLWPATLFWWALALTYTPSATRKKKAIARVPRGLAWGIFCVANVGVAGTVLFFLGRQPAADELAVSYRGAQRLSLATGPGWFPRESMGNEYWIWSQGESSLLLRHTGEETRTVNVHFGIRGLGERTVMARMEGRAVWKGAVSSQFEEVTIPGVALAPGQTSLLFTTDTPGIPESATANARALTFALYNLRLD